MHTQALLTALLLSLTTSTPLALAQSSAENTGYFITVPSDTPGAAPTLSPPSSPSSSEGEETIPDLVSALPSCALPCLTSGASAVQCSLTDLRCLCQRDKIESFAISIGSCLTGGIGGDGGPAAEDEACALDSLSAQAAAICSKVNNISSPGQQGELSSASAVVSDRLQAEASRTGTAPPGSQSTSGGGENQAGHGKKPEGKAMGMLAVVAAYAVLAL